MRLLILAFTVAALLVPEDAAARRPWFRRFRPVRESAAPTASNTHFKFLPAIDINGDGIADDLWASPNHPSLADLSGDGISDVPPSAFAAPLEPAPHQFKVPIGR